jgi:hypothetical protein
MVRGIPNKGERDTSSENSQTSVIKALSNLSLTLTLREVFGVSASEENT